MTNWYGKGFKTMIMTLFIMHISLRAKEGGGRDQTQLIKLVIVVRVGVAKFNTTRKHDMIQHKISKL